MRILLVEDNAQLCASLERGFREIDVPLEAVRTGRAALERLAQNSSDAVILDLGLPDLDGLDVLVTAREAGVIIPVLVLSARDAVEQRILALDRGADDFLLKPFVFGELVARMRALVRRVPAPGWSSLQIGNVRIDATDTRVRIGGGAVELSPREHTLLHYLVQHADRVVSRREILIDVFGYNFEPNTNVVDVHVSHLRRKLNGANVRLETVRGRGYSLRGPSAGKR